MRLCSFCWHALGNKVILYFFSLLGLNEWLHDNANYTCYGLHSHQILIQLYKHDFNVLRQCVHELPSKHQAIIFLTNGT